MSTINPKTSSFSLLQLQGKVGVIFGIANQRSIAWSTAELLLKSGAELALSVLDERANKRAQELLVDQSETSKSFVSCCDLREPEQLEALVKKVHEQWGQIDFIVHSVAFADLIELKKEMSACSKEGYLKAMEISAFSLLAIVHAFRPLLAEGASIITLSYLGAEVAIPSYGLMGPVKAALESEVRYLAAELGPQQVRVNVVSAGPLKTLSASAIPGFKQHLKDVGESTPRGQGVQHQEVANVICFLCSSMSSGISGETIHVDAGQHAIRQY